MSVQERVVRGTRWLDHVRPGWRDSLELGTLDLSNGGQCVLGQVFSEEAAAYAGRKVCGYSYVLTAVLTPAEWRVANAVRHGMSNRVIASRFGISLDAVKFHVHGPSEIKRMWVAPAARGLGLGRRLLSALEQQAVTSNPVVRLETNAALEEAIRLYRSSGYVEVSPFNDEAYADHWFEKCLTP